MEPPVADTPAPTPPAAEAEQSEAKAFSPIENDAPLRGWRRFGIVPSNGLGVGRRALLLAMLSWLPIAIWAATTGHLSAAQTGESLREHYAVHVRCLIVIPCLILAELTLHRVVRHIASQFATSGLITSVIEPEFGRINRVVVRLREASLPWMIALGVAVAVSIADSPSPDDDRIAWAIGPDGRVGFGGLWYSYVARPILAALLLGWVWRLVIVTVWMWRVGRLPLAFVATHPDRTGGIGFVQTLPRAFAPVTFATASILVGRWAHEVAHHGALLASFQPLAITYAVVWSLALLIPLLALYPALWSTRRKALPLYAALVGEQARLLHRRWIERQPADEDPLMEPQGIGVMADSATVYDAVRSMRAFPIGRRTLLAILVPMAIPFLLLVMLQFPLKSILLTLLNVLA
jgi:hypothetical protein